MNNEQTPAIEFRNVSISFDDVQALRNASFTLPPGEMICVTGDSDSGKSVLLRLALGFLRPDEGRIFINGRETAAMSVPRKNPYLTTRDLIVLGKIPIVLGKITIALGKITNGRG